MPDYVFFLCVCPQATQHWSVHKQCVLLKWAESSAWSAADTISCDSSCGSPVPVYLPLVADSGSVERRQKETLRKNSAQRRQQPDSAKTKTPARPPRQCAVPRPCQRRKRHLLDLSRPTQLPPRSRQPNVGGRREARRHAGAFLAALQVIRFSSERTARLPPAERGRL